MKKYVVIANPHRRQTEIEILKYTNSYKVAHQTMIDRCRWDAVGIFETATGKVEFDRTFDRPANDSAFFFVRS